MTKNNSYTIKCNFKFGNENQNDVDSDSEYQTSRIKGVAIPNSKRIAFTTNAQAI